MDERDERDEAERDGEAPPDGSPLSEDRVARVLRTFREEPTLWPVGLVVFLSLSSFGALVLVYAIQLRGIAAGIALILLIFMTVYHLDPDIRARKLRPTSAVLMAFWAGSGVVALLLNGMGAF